MKKFYGIKKHTQNFPAKIFRLPICTLLCTGIIHESFHKRCGGG